MSVDKYPSIFSRQMATIVYIFPNFQNCAQCEKDLKDNKDNSQIETIVYLLNIQPRIMQFWLSDWFTVSRLPAIIPTFDLIWKLMLQMSIFLWEAAFRR